MSIYLDSSALVKLVVEEPESEDLRTFVGDRVVVSSMVARTEVIRAVARTEPERVGAAEKVLAETSLIIIDGPLASAAAWVEPASIRSLDAIHLATAQRLEVGLEALVTYDRRMVDAAQMAGLRVASPGDKSA
ncbi:MAG TPA: type II toxin-antitoxin system VapC family toxin [Mycobacteriales bacterium]|jgi:predicted nucleic acid-binding protein|nr:type II toxin-antitoxin system VapC family toxin [Mycobacteriales bacterium]